MLELSEEIRTTRARRDDCAVYPQFVHGVADTIAEIRSIGRRTGRWHRFPELNVIRQNHSVGKHISESAARFVRREAEDRVHIRSEKGQLGEVPLWINRQFNK